MSLSRTILTREHSELLERERRLGHSARFRKVSNRYPHVVAQAYDGYLEAAAADSDEQVAETVAWWERTQGLAPRDWHAIGRAEGRSS
jgi:hypothetical protein